MVEKIITGTASCEQVHCFEKIEIHLRTVSPTFLFLDLGLFKSGVYVAVCYGGVLLEFLVMHNGYSMMVRNVDVSSDPDFPLTNCMSLGNLPDCLNLGIHIYKMMVIPFHHRAFSFTDSDPYSSR